VRTRVEQFAVIRRDHRVDGLSIRALAGKHHVHRRTVRQALESAIPSGAEDPATGGAAKAAATSLTPSRLEPFKSVIRRRRADKAVPRGLALRPR
jgi:hypothetical protein